MQQFSSFKNSIINYKSGRKTLLSLGQGNVHEWIESLLPNTRIILEPKIIGTDIGIQYLNGKVNKAINVAINKIEEDGIGRGKINYRLRDAIFSRQRYWGEPFPVYYNCLLYTSDAADE